MDSDPATVDGDNKLKLPSTETFLTGFYLVLSSSAHGFMGLHQIEEFEMNLDILVTGDFDVPCAVSIGGEGWPG